jgi:uncharacterized membrane protein
MYLGKKSASEHEGSVAGKLLAENANLQNTLITNATWSLSRTTPNCSRQILRDAHQMDRTTTRCEHDAQPANKVELHPTPIVDARPVPPRLAKVARHLSDSVSGLYEQRLVQLRSNLAIRRPASQVSWRQLRRGRGRRRKGSYAPVALYHKTS